MELLHRNDVKTLMEQKNGVCVSIFMPANPVAPEGREENRIRFKNLLKEAHKQLEVETDLRSPTIEELLAPGQQLLEDSAFWSYQDHGFATFLAADFFRTYRLPLDFEKLVVVADRFHVKPLLPLLSGNGRFYVLALSGEETRLFQGTRDTIEQLQPETLPDGIAEALAYEDPERRLQFHTATGATRESGDRSAVFYGHDVTEEQKDALRRYFQQVDEGLQAVLRDEGAPLVLAAVAYLIPIYREANTYSHLLEEGVTGNPEEASAAELHRQAWQIVEPIFTVAQEEAAARYRELAHTGQASSDLQKVVKAAYFGRVETLFTTVDQQRWGTLDKQTGQIDVHEKASLDDVDLLDLAAVHTLSNSGTVYAVPAEESPNQEMVAAVFRY